MWCMMNSPLLAGNDLRDMSKETIEILTNKEIIALNQDTGFYQARRISKDGDIEVWVKLLGENGSNGKAISLMNRNEKEQTFTFKPEIAGLDKSDKIRDLWEHKDLGKIGKEKVFTIPAHGVIVLKTL